MNCVIRNINEIKLSFYKILILTFCNALDDHFVIRFSLFYFVAISAFFFSLKISWGVEKCIKKYFTNSHHKSNTINLFAHILK